MSERVLLVLVLVLVLVLLSVVLLLVHLDKALLEAVLNRMEIMSEAVFPVEQPRDVVRRRVRSLLAGERLDDVLPGATHRFSNVVPSSIVGWSVG